jgi:2',3'-cyclic-nucleotide 3'-phosphodiesterase
MKVILILCGIPGSGKSTWVKENSLENYSISKDNLRLMYFGTIYNKYGIESVKTVSERFIHEKFMEILETRLRNNSFVVIDNTNVNINTVNHIKNLASFYGYTVLFKVFRTSLDECLRRNSSREYLYKVKESDIIKMNWKLNNLIDNRVISREINDIHDICKIEESMDRINLFPNQDLFIVGDIHGCYNELDKFLNSIEYTSSKDNVLVFCGDYIDRGPDNISVMNRIIDISNKKSNSYFIEGNHERSLRCYAYSRELSSKEFIGRTKCQLDSDSKLKDSLKTFLLKLRTHLLISPWRSQEKYLVCHGGISWINNILNNEVWKSPESVIKGSDYPNGGMNELSDIFMNSSYNIIQFHGHRSLDNPKVNKSVINLDGNVDQGGYLRVAKISNGRISILKY